MNVLFLCVANSARSQMAEGLARALPGVDATFYSAGSQPSHVRKQAIEVLADVGIDMKGHTSKSVNNVPIEAIDVVITLCHEEVCPVVLTHAQRLHWPIPDPAGFEDEPWEVQLERFRRARDTIAGMLQDYFKG